MNHRFVKGVGSNEDPPLPRCAASARHPPGEFASALVEFTDDVLFGQGWERGVLSPKKRNLVTVACLVTSGNTDQLVYHLRRARDNGATEDDLVDAITHLAFYAGWPKAMSATTGAKDVLRSAAG